MKHRTKAKTGEREVACRVIDLTQVRVLGALFEVFIKRLPGNVKLLADLCLGKTFVNEFAGFLHFVRIDGLASFINPARFS